MELTRRARAGLILFAFAGTAAYAASLGAGAGGWSFSRVGISIAIAAALSWPLFGLALLAIRRRGGFWMCVDHCLRTMATGTIVLCLATLFNLLRWSGWMSASPLDVAAANLILLLASDVTMAAHFVTGADRVGISRVAAIALWIGVLNGAFGLLILLP